MNNQYDMYECERSVFYENNRESRGGGVLLIPNGFNGFWVLGEDFSRKK